MSSETNSIASSQTQPSNPTTASDKNTPTPPGGASPSGNPPSGRKKMIVSVFAVIIFLAACHFFYENYFYVATDNATVQAHATLLSPQVRGIIVRANVEENQKVKAGQVLVEIKPDDYQNSLKQKEAEMNALRAQFHGAELTYRRTLALLKKGASTQERLDLAEAQYRSSESKFNAAQAEVSEAKLNLGYTQITAPVDGKVGRKSFEVGMLAAPGQPLLGFVANNERWITANLKETDMDEIVEGKKAYVTVDAIRNHEFEGVVDSISPATGATFTLLPPDNATGNFTKVVQRVPVRIKLLNLTEHDTDRLQNGLSAYVKIRIR